MKRLTIIASLTLLPAALAGAQCPDGTPPPCGGRPIARAVASFPAAAERGRRFLILPFRNVTRQPEQEWLVEGSTTMLVDALARWQGITVVSDEKLYPALKRAGIVPGAIADAPRVRRVAEETGGWTAVTGEVLSSGGRMRITARAWDVPTNRELVRTASEVVSGGDVRAAYDSVSLRLLRSAGLDSVTPDLANTTTRNLDSYRAYLRGLAHTRRTELTSALKEFKEAVRLDSTFALAWARLAEATISVEPGSLLNPGSAAAQYSARAVALSAKLPPRSRQLVLANDASFRAQFGEARRLLEGLVAADSNDVEALNALVGLEMFDPILVDVPGGQRPRGSFNRAARLAKRLVEIDPSRHVMFGMLASIFASAGVPGSQPTIGVTRAPSSFPDFIRIIQQREHLRLYSLLMTDTLMLVPAESLAAIPKDSVRAMQKRARAVGRSWADRWVTASEGIASPYALMSELHALDGEYPAALKALAKAESLGVQTPAWSGPAKRMTYLGKQGNLGAAGRLADSLTAAGFFGKPTNMLSSTAAGPWAFALHLAAGKFQSAGELYRQSVTLRKMMNPGTDIAELTAFLTLMGNTDPEDEPGIPRSLRTMQLDTLLARIVELSAADPIAGWVPGMLPMLAEAIDPAKPRVAGMLKAAAAVASSGRASFAFQLSSNAVDADSTLEAEASGYSWYRTGADALTANRRSTQGRFRPATATVTADRAVFEWSVSDSAPFPRNRPETPVSTGEYRWRVSIDAGDRRYQLTASDFGRTPVSTPASGGLADILTPTARRSVTTGRLLPSGVQQDTTMLQGVALKTEIAPGVLRMVVTDRAILDLLERTRPAQARFRFLPCARPPGAGGKSECVDQLIAITYPR